MEALVVGEAVLDVVRVGDEVSERPGGSAVNAAVALARLGRPTALATSVGADRAGELVLAHAEAAGVRPIGEPRLLERTSRADAVIGAGGAASYSFDVGWRLPDLAGLADRGAEAPHVVHVTSLAPLLEPGGDATLALLERLRGDTTVSYDINLRPGITGAGADVLARVRRMAGLADLVKASDEDLAALWPMLTVGEAASLLLRLGPRAVVVTHGGAGASWHAGVEPDWSTGGIHAQPTTVVDTIGAGDTFAAALLDHLWPLLGAGGGDRVGAQDAEQWTAALTHAARAAAVTVGRVGADPPTREDLTGAAIA